MEKSTERKIAKEVIILFVSIFAIVSIWIAFWAVNKRFIYKTGEFKHQLIIQMNTIDSIQSSIIEIVVQKMVHNKEPSTKINQVISDFKSSCIVLSHCIDPIIWDKYVIKQDLNEVDLLPILKQLDEYKKTRDQLQYEVNITPLKIYSTSKLIEIAIYISIVVLMIIYPFRFLIILFLWSIKIIRQKSE